MDAKNVSGICVVYAKEILKICQLLNPVQRNVNGSMNKNKKLLDSFVAYCQQHPEERFWQALRNWSRANYILMVMEGQLPRDTFYMEDKNGEPCD